MPEPYVSRFAGCAGGKQISEWEAKVTGLDKFFPLLEAEEIPGSSDTLRIVFRDAVNAKSKTHYFVHKSQAVFRIATQPPQA